MRMWIEYLNQSNEAKGDFLNYIEKAQSALINKITESLNASDVNRAMVLNAELNVFREIGGKFNREIKNHVQQIKEN